MTQTRYTISTKGSRTVVRREDKEGKFVVARATSSAHIEKAARTTVKVTAPAVRRRKKKR